jgi:hypothetical protein
MYRTAQYSADVFSIMIVMNVMVLSASLAVGAAFWFKIRTPLARMLEFHDEVTALQRDLPTPPSGSWYQHDGFADDLSSLASATQPSGLPARAPRPQREMRTVFHAARPGGRQAT